MKKIISLVLALIMIFSLALVVSADETPTPETGSITITGIAVKTEDGVTSPLATYKIYKLLDVASYKHDNTTNVTNISYVANDPVWEQFFKDSLSYQVDTGTKVVTLIGSEDNTTVAVRTAEKAKELIDSKNGDADDDNNIEAVCSTECNITEHVSVESNGTGTGDLTFNGLELGYYLIESDMGILCGIDTAAPNGVVVAKNAPPSMSKLVQEDSLVASGTASWADNNHADIGQIVNFDITIVARAGAENYVVHDKMDHGLTFVPESVEIYHLISENNYSRDENTPPLKDGTDYILKIQNTQNAPSDNDCTFEIEFTDTFLKKVDTSDKIVILYSAKLNDNATVGQENPNKNTAYVSYGSTFKTVESVTKTYTYRMDLVKIDGYTRDLIDGAEFVVSNKSNLQLQYEDGTVKIVGTNYESDLIKFSKISSATKINTYHIEDAAHVHGTGDYIISAKDGKATFTGLDAGVYYLYETKAPAGYNKLSTPHKVEVDQNHNWITYDEKGDRVVNSTTGVIIENNIGNELPSTGAMGTAMFITFGMIVVLATGVLLVTKKRMAMIQD